MLCLSMSNLLACYSHEILSEGKRGLSAPYGEHWRKWRKVNLLLTRRRMKFITPTRIYFGVAPARGDEWQGCAILPRATDT